MVSSDGQAFVTNDFEPGHDIDDRLENCLIINYFKQDKTWRDLYTNNKITKDEFDLLAEFDNIEGENMHFKFQVFKKHHMEYMKIYAKTMHKRITYFMLLLLRLSPGSEDVLGDLRQHFVKISKKDGTLVYHFKRLPGLAPPLPSSSSSSTSSPAPAPSLSSSSSSSITYSSSMPAPTTPNPSPSVLFPSPSSSPATSSSVPSSPSYSYINNNANTTTPVTPTTIKTASLSRSPSANFSTTSKELTQADIIYRNSILFIIKERKIEIPEIFLCPITQQLMFDPVFTCDGHTYEREAIQKWILKGNKTSPLTNDTLQHFILTPNHFAKTIIIQFLEKHQLLEKDLLLKQA